MGDLTVALQDHYLIVWDRLEGATQKAVALATCRDGEIRLRTTVPQLAEMFQQIVMPADARAQRAAWWRVHVPTGLPLCSVAARGMTYLPTESYPMAGHEDTVAAAEATLEGASFDEVLGTAIAET